MEYNGIPKKRNFQARAMSTIDALRGVVLDAIVVGRERENRMRETTGGGQITTPRKQNSFLFSSVHVHSFDKYHLAFVSTIHMRMDGIECVLLEREVSEGIAVQ